MCATNERERSVSVICLMITEEDCGDNDDDEDDIYDTALMNLNKNVTIFRLDVYLCNKCGLNLLLFKCLQHTGLCVF
jgi:hypothetical protein